MALASVTMALLTTPLYVPQPSCGVLHVLPALTLHLRPQAPLFYPSSGRTCGLEGRGDDDGGDTTHIMGSGDEGVKELFEKDVSTPHVVNVGIDRCSSQTQQWRDAIRCVHANQLVLCHTQHCSELVPRVPHTLHSTKILPQMVEFNPDLILVSAGFDAHREVASDTVGAALLLQGSHTSPLVRTSSTMAS